MKTIELTHKGKEYANMIKDEDGLREGHIFWSLSALESKILRYLLWRYNVDGEEDVKRVELLMHLNQGESELEDVNARLNKGLAGLEKKELVEEHSLLSYDFADDYVPEAKPRWNSREQMWE